MPEQFPNKPEVTHSSGETLFNHGDDIGMHESNLGTAAEGRERAAAAYSTPEQIKIPGHEQLAVVSLRTVTMRQERANGDDLHPDNLTLAA